MTDSAQDYTYEVTRIDSSGLATITMTSYDSLEYFTGMKVNASTTDSDVVKFVESRVENALEKWADQRATPTITIGSAALRFRNRITNEEPDYNYLTQKSVPYETIDSDTITVNYSLTSLNDSEKAEVYSNLFLSRASLWNRLEEDNRLDSVLSGLKVPMGAHATWDASAEGSFDWSTDRISSRNVSNVERVSAGRYKVHFKNALPDTGYTAVCTTGSTDYSGYGASTRNLSVMNRTTDYLEVICERSDDAVNEDNFYNSVLIVNADDEHYDSHGINILHQERFQFGDAITKKIQTILGKNDSDMAVYL
jgi:hypothetical protein